MQEINRFLCSRQLLLRKKAAEELKKEQERKAAERRRIIEERCGKPKNLDDTSEGKASGTFCPLLYRFQMLLIFQSQEDCALSLFSLKRKNCHKKIKDI